MLGRERKMPENWRKRYGGSEERGNVTRKENRKERETRIKEQNTKMEGGGSKTEGGGG